MKTRSDHEARGQMLVRGLRADDGGTVVRAHAGRKAPMLFEVLLEFLRVHAPGVACGTLLGPVAEHRGPFPVEVNQLLGHDLALGRIGMQQLRRALPAQDCGEFPSQVEGVLHGEVHALPGLGAVGVAGITGDEHVGKPGAWRVGGDLVVLVADALADFVHRPPGNLLDVQLVGMQDAPRRGDELVERDAAFGDPLVFAQLFHLHVEARQVATLARNHQQVAASGLHRHFESDVRKIGHGQHVHHAPRLVGGVAHQAATDGRAHRAARAVAANDIARPHRFQLARMDRIGSLHVHRDRVICGGAVHRHIQQAAGVMRLQPAWRVAHHIEIEVMDPGLVQDHVGKLRQAVFRVLHTAVAHDVQRPLLVRLPEGHFIDPAGLLEDPLTEIEGLEHLHGPAGNTVRLPQQQRAILLLDDAGLDVWKCSQLRCQREACRSTTHDQHVHV